MTTPTLREDITFEVWCYGYPGERQAHMADITGHHFKRALSREESTHYHGGFCPDHGTALHVYPEYQD